MNRIVIGLLCAMGGYVIAGVSAYFLILRFSSNVHDRAIEAAMTSAFVLGPLGALLALLAGLVLGSRSRR